MARRSWEFGEYEVDAVAPELRRRGKVIRLQVLPHKLLLLLLERRGEVVTREELRQHLWPDGHFVDFEHGLNTAVKKLRAALSESVTAPLYIETVPRAGYRFVGEATDVSSVASDAAVNRTAEKAPAARTPRSVAAAVVGIVIVLGATAAALFHNRGSAGTSSIAVLPFDNLSGDHETDYFSDGITEAVITDLGRLGIARVISRTSTAQSKRSGKKLPEIARDLGVQYIVEGGVLRSPDRVRVTVQLIDGRTDGHVWAESYERDLRDVISLQDEIARAIAHRITGTLVRREPRRPRHEVVPEAYDAYLIARHELDDWSSANLEKSVAYFEEAVRRDPQYAAAAAGVAQAYALLAGFRFMPAEQGRANVERAARQAVALDPDLSDAHVALGEVYEQQFSFAAAEQEFRRAVALNPNDPIAHQRLGYALDRAGQVDEAVQEMLAGSERDPLSPTMRNALGAAYFRARRDDEALPIIRALPDGDANSERRHRRLALIYEEHGMERAASEEWVRSITPGTKGTSDIARVCASVRYTDCREAALFRDIEHLRERGHFPLTIAEDFALLSKPDEAIASIREAFATRTGSAFYVRDREWDSIRSDPRFAPLASMYLGGR